MAPGPSNRATAPVTPIIYFEPDGYVLNTPVLMGRQSAGHGFLRAAVEARGAVPVTAFAPLPGSPETFRELVAEIDPAAPSEVIDPRRLDLVAQAGLLYRPDLFVGRMARQRLRVGPAAYAICGITHTLSTTRSLDAISDLATAPVMPWDAIICTSHVAREVLGSVLDHERELQRWRTGHDGPSEGPLLPVIPLGVHCRDFDFSEADRLAARQALGLDADTVAIVAPGRLSPHDKVHPYATLHAVQCVATATGQPIALLFAGQIHTPELLEGYQKAAADFCPGVRTVFIDGADAAAYGGAWAAADVFVSLADSIQETFGLTPVEAMAAGLPALVSDWDGYKDTVRDGVDGLRIRTWAPAPGVGVALAQDFESGAADYGNYLYRANSKVAVDMGRLVEGLTALVGDPGLRRRMGAAGRARARESFDWSVVYRSYQALWAEQQQMREAALADPGRAAWLARAPRRGSSHLGPYDTFASFPSLHVDEAVQVALTGAFTPQAYAAFVAHPLISRFYVSAAAFQVFSARLADGPMTVAQLISATGWSRDQVIEACAGLAKFGAVALAPGPGA